MPFFAVSCVEDLVNPDQDSQQKEKVTLTLHADADTKTMLVDGKYVWWEEGDIVDINEALYTVRIDENDPSIAYVDDVVAADAYYAHYSGTWFFWEEDGIVFDIPTIQRYRPGSFESFTNQMIAYGTSTDLHFYNAASIIKLGIQGNGEMVKNVTISSNNGEPMTGYYIATFSDFENLKEYEGLQNDNIYIKRTYVQLNVDGQMQLGGTPQYVYLVVSPQTYAEGFTVTVEDMEGRLCYQSTSKSVTTKRSEILRMADFTFNAAEALAVADVKPGNTSIEYTLTSVPGKSIRHAVVTKALWDKYMKDYGEGYEAAAATAILNACGNPGVMSETGSMTLNAVATCNLNGFWLPIVADTEYKVIASYANMPSVGTVAVSDVKTSEASDSIGAIIAECSASETEIYLNIRVPENAVSMISIYGMKSTVDEFIGSGMTHEDIVNIWGGSADEEMLASAKTDSGYTYQYSGLEKGMEYSFIFAVTTGGGALAMYVADVRTESVFGVTEWEVYSTAAAMNCGLMAPFGINEFIIKGITVEKAKNEDIFRIVDLNEVINKRIGYYFDQLDAPQYFYIDARDNASVKITPEMNLMYMGGGSVSFMSAAELAEGYMYGIYHKGTDVLDLGDIAMRYVDNEYYLAVSSTSLYFNGVMDGWGVVGDLNGWGYGADGSTVQDIQMTSDQSGNYLVAYNVNFPTDGRFKLRQYGEWIRGYGNVGLNQMNGVLEVDHVYNVVNSWSLASDMYAYAGTYDIWYDIENCMLYLMTPGKSVSEAVPGTPGEIPEPDPDPEEGTWGIVGLVNNWGNPDENGNVMKDIVMKDLSGGMYVAENVTFPDGGFKFRKNNEWNDEFNLGLTAPGTVEVDHVYSLVCGGGSGDMLIAAGTYDVYLDEYNMKVYIMTPGKDISEALQPGDNPDPAVEWYLVGDFNGWTCADSAYKMIEETDYYVFRNFRTDEGAELKFNVGDWTVDRGGTFEKVNSPVSLTQGGMNIVLPAGTYDIYLNKNADTAYFMTPGLVPGESGGNDDGLGTEDFSKGDEVEW